MSIQPRTPRQAGTSVVEFFPGCDVSADYVVESLEAAAYRPSDCSRPAWFWYKAPPHARGGRPGPDWSEFSTNFGTPICNASFGVVPLSGEWFAWCGGITQFEEGWLQQDLVIDAAASELTFAWQIAACANSVNDYVRLMLGGNTVWEKNAADPACGQTEPAIASIDLATANGGPYNEGESHTIRFESSVLATNGGISNFFIDDACILVDGSRAVPSTCTEETVIFRGGFEPAE